MSGNLFTGRSAVRVMVCHGELYFVQLHCTYLLQRNLFCFNMIPTYNHTLSIHIVAFRNLVS